MTKTVPFKTLLGKTLTSARVLNDEVVYFNTDSEEFRLFHWQDCCEGVYVESVVGDLQDLIGEPLLVAEQVESLPLTPEQLTLQEGRDSYTWTFYKLATRKGYVDIRWFGSSNGYYSESVTFEQVNA
jgi:hypothetical protein